MGDVSSVDVKAGDQTIQKMIIVKIAVIIGLNMYKE